MVVDMELEEAKKNVLELMKKKDEIEAELKQLKDVLTKNHVDMNDSLVDSEGFPRSDIDVYQVRISRHKIICLQNDHKALMKQIDNGLIKIHGISGHENGNNNALQAASSSSSSSTTTTMMIDDFDNYEAFLRVDFVSPSSPAELAGIMVDDLIIEFGSVNAQNYKSLKDIGDIVENSRYKQVIVKIRRSSEQNMALTLIPRPWTGKGLLGCHIVPLEIVER
ncbi:hypothetical protein HCN44_008889 [Aphidius gifuensis]|uniref:26S proteasome non-ATPase regulatory subunit 9 n=1 Tax=Aphidius gifuensis TaxID=684658 RepID=A0A835CRS4_APHGI|nr:26S proteasome non-ATPase regulatory subunit 9 [Aphidius gifuensis]KAF7991518.1 hypothetical protein HCN44_008889 [Aphidius gifuensis]